MSRSLIAFSLCVAAATSSLAATRAKPHKDHIWSIGTYNGRPAALALGCPDCEPTIALYCPQAGRGLLRFALPGAAVANGRDGATKQVRVIIGDHIEWRRAETYQTRVFADSVSKLEGPIAGPALRYLPRMDLATDDPLLSRLIQTAQQNGTSVVFNFYGQRTVVGLAKAADTIEVIRQKCRAPAEPERRQHCVWSLTLMCSPLRRHAVAVQQNYDRAIVRRTAKGYCATLAYTDLSKARTEARRRGVPFVRSCLGATRTPE